MSIYSAWGLVALLLAVTFHLLSRMNPESMVLFRILGMSSLGASLWLFHLGKRDAARGPGPDKSPKPSVLLLRSFLADGSSEPTAWWLRAPYGPPQSHEVVLQSVLAPHASLIAIGQPGETLPPLGFRRVQYGEHEWRERVVQHMRDAVATIIRIGTTESLRWEIETAFAILRPSQLVLMLPPTAQDRIERIRDDPRREAEYQTFLSWFRRLDVPEAAKDSLPTTLDRNVFVRFDEDWDAEPISSHSLHRAAERVAKRLGLPPAETGDA